MDNATKTRLLAQIAAAVEARLGASAPGLEKLIAQEVGAALEHRGTDGLLAAVRASGHDEIERVVVSAHGRNKGGIVARIANAVDEFQGDIRDISQTIVGDYFTMILVVDIASARRAGSHFASLKERLARVGEELGIQVAAMHDDLLSTMHGV